MKKILFVCLGNICRSPAAEGVFLTILKKRGLSHAFIVDSAGTSGYHDGEWPDERMIKQALKRSVVLPTQSRKILKEDLLNFDFILCMDQSNVNNVLKLDPENLYSSKIKLFTDYRKDMNYHFVPDPYFGTLSDFDLVLDIVTDASIGFLESFCL